MEKEENKTSQTNSATCPNPEQKSDSGENPPPAPPPTTVNDGEKPKIKTPDSVCETTIATCSNPEQNPDSSDDPPPPPPPPPATAKDGEEPKIKDPETVCETKRRKKCPSALDKCESILKSCSNSSFSFTFDPKFCSGATTPEDTPKFGSFNFVAAAAEIEEEKIEEKEQDVEEKAQINQKRKIIEVLGSVEDGFGSAD